MAIINVTRNDSALTNINFSGSTIADLKNSLYAQALGVQSSDVAEINGGAASDSDTLFDGAEVVFRPVLETEIEVRFGLSAKKIKISSGTTYAQFLSNPDYQAQIGFRSNDKIYVNGIIPDYNQAIPAGATLYIEKTADVKGC